MKKVMGKHPKMNSDYTLDVNISNIVVNTKEIILDKDGEEIFSGESKMEHLNKVSLNTTLPGVEGQPQTLTQRQKDINAFVEAVEILYTDLHKKL